MPAGFAISLFVGHCAAENRLNLYEIPLAWDGQQVNRDSAVFC